MGKGGAVYILTNKNKTTLYVGVTSDLVTRVIEHKTKKDPNCFTAKYNVDFLVYYELYHSIEEAIAREKQIKAGPRRKKEQLINNFNADRRDLWEEIKNW